MLKALIVDDESKAREMMALLIGKYAPEIAEFRMAIDGESALKVLEDFSPDILFLDIQMPRMGGFDLLSALQRWQFDVIFTTAHQQYAIQAIKFSALDYLLKPIDPAEFQSAVKRHLAKRENNGAVESPQHELVQNLLQNLQHTSTPKDQKLAI